MKKSTQTGGRSGATRSRNVNSEKSGRNHSENNHAQTATTHVSAPHAARKGITSAKKMPGHPVRKVDARSLHRILTWSIELSQRQKQLMDAAIEILTNAKNG